MKRRKIRKAKNRISTSIDIVITTIIAITPTNSFAIHFCCIRPLSICIFCLKMSHAVNLLSSSEEVIFLEQLELLKQQNVEFPPNVERLYVKLSLRKVVLIFPFSIENARSVSPAL